MPTAKAVAAVLSTAAAAFVIMRSVAGQSRVGPVLQTVGGNQRPRSARLVHTCLGVVTDDVVAVARPSK